MRHVVFGFLLLPNALAAELPSGGTCDFRGVPGFETSVTWQGDTASVTNLFSEVPARVVGMRVHDSGFKVSFFFDHPITGAMEAVLFSDPATDGTRYRLGLVGYESAADGERVLSFISAFQPGICMLQ